MPQGAQQSLINAILTNRRADALDHIKALNDLNFFVEVEGMGTVTPLHLMSTTSWVELIELMLAKGARCDVGDQNGNTPLHYAQNSNQFEIARRLVLQMPALRTMGNHQRQTPLHDAAEKNKLNFITLYLALHIHNIPVPCLVDPRNDKERTPLHLAAIKGNIDVAQMLIQADANVHAVDCGNYTPYAYPYVAGNDAFALILKQHMIPSLFCLAAQKAFVTHQNRDQHVAECVLEQAQVTVNFALQNHHNTLVKAQEIKQQRQNFINYLRKSNPN